MQITLATKRIGQGAIFGLRHGIDGQVAARQILLQRHIGVGVKDEATIARRGLAFGTRQGVLFMRLRVQKDGKILAHRRVSGSHHVLRCGANHHEVTILHRQAEQSVTDRAADQVTLHRQPQSG